MVTLSIDAASLAFLAHYTGVDSILVPAREKYVAAIRLTNTALSNPEQATQYATLIACFLLDIFEKLTNKNSHESKSWSGHISGCLAIISSRGFDEFREPGALSLLSLLCINCLTSCIACDLAVPRELIELRAYVESCMPDVSVKWRLSNLLVHFANLRSAMHAGMLTLDQCIQETMSYDVSLDKFRHTIDAPWQYTRKYTSHDSARRLEHFYDVYPSRHVTQSWNMLRYVRIFVNEMLLQFFEAKGDAHSVRDYSETAVRNIHLLSSEICASLPPSTDCEGARMEVSRERDYTPGNPHAHPSSQNIDCYPIILPLYVVARSRYSPQYTRDWVTEQFYYMNDHLGIHQAKVLADILRENRDINPWDAYAAVGGYAFACC